MCSSKKHKSGIMHTAVLTVVIIATMLTFSQFAISISPLYKQGGNNFQTDDIAEFGTLE